MISSTKNHHKRTKTTESPMITAALCIMERTGSRLRLSICCKLTMNLTNLCSATYNGKPSMVPFDAKYTQTLGSPFVSYYELLMLNKHYGCLGKLEEKEQNWKLLHVGIKHIHFRQMRKRAQIRQLRTWFPTSSRLL